MASRTGRLNLGVVVVPWALIVACGPDPSPPQRSGVRVEVVARGLSVPWSIALAPDSRIFVTERTGRIRVIVHDSLRRDPWATLPAYDGTDRRLETGLMGLALDPDFPARPFVYACYTEVVADEGIVNRLVRLRDSSGRGVDVTTLIERIPAGPYHDGCRVKIGPDRKLYVTTGDSYKSAVAQEVSSLAGKVLRFNLDGSVPSDNPTAGSPVWTLGHRNPQGLAWDPRTGRAIVSEHGDAQIDEFNILERGANYGWPEVEGRVGSAHYRDPAIVFHVAPAGIAFLPGTQPSGPSHLLVTTLTGQRLLELLVTDTTVVRGRDSLLVGYGRLRDVAVDAGGNVYVATSNRDNRGQSRRGDDKVLRLRFPEAYLPEPHPF